VSDTRQRIIEATSALFMQQGYAGTGLKAIAEAGEATTGSLYHFFPGGKAELAAETLRHSGQAYEDLVMGVLDAFDEPVEGMRSAFESAAEVLRATDYVDACPIATVALEVASSDEALRLVTAEVFAGWLRAAATRFEALGVAPDAAADLATQFVALLEGGFLLCRVAKDTEPMVRLGRAMAQLLEAALAEVPTRA
jgi:AcrR family transcriptional regulator